MGASGWSGACLGLGVAALALAATAAPLPYSAALDLDMGSFPSLSAQAAGTLEVADDGSFSLPASLFEVNQTVAAPSQFFTRASFVFHNGTGAFGGPSHPGGPMPLLGKVRLFAKNSSHFPPASLPLTQGFSGGTGTVMVSNGASKATAALEGSGATWRTGTVRQFGSTAASTFDTRTNVGTDMRTPMGIGSMSLVIPVSFRRSLDGSFQELEPVSGTVSITFSPEPRRLLLEMGGVGALALLGARRMRILGRK